MIALTMKHLESAAKFLLVGNAVPQAVSPFNGKSSLSTPQGGLYAKKRIMWMLHY